MYPSRIRLSTSAHDLLLSCERKFQIIELLKGGKSEESNAIFSFGHSWGEGLVEYLQTGDLDAAIYKAWLCYWPHLEDTTSNRLEELVFHGLRYAKDKLDRIRSEWEIAEFNGKPARELGFHLNINERFYFESSIDAVLRHKVDSHYAILENKHTFSWLDDITPMYKNSSQGLSYSIILDRIAGQPLGQYSLHYLIGQFKSIDLTHPIIHFYPWKKTLVDRLNWFLSLGMDVQRLTQMLDMNLFPMRGKNCLQYNRQCQFFGTCQLRANDFPKTDADVMADKTQHVKEVEDSIQFRFELKDIVAEHLEQVRQELQMK